MYGEISARGGARIGWLNATWPFARLTANRSSLYLKVLIFGNYQFSPENIVTLEKYGLIPFLGQGVRIHHNIQEYPAKIVFWCMGSPDRLIRRIKEAGFIATGRIHDQEKRSGFPMRLLPIVLMVILWNVLFLADEKYRTNKELGPGALLALLLFTIIPLGIKYYKPLQRIFMKEGRDPKEMGAWLNFLPILSGSMFVLMLLAYLTK